MRTAIELVRATKPFAREVRWRSWWHCGSTLAVLASLLGLTCLEVPWGGRLPVSVLAGLVMVRMFAVYHDHQLRHRTSRATGFVARTNSFAVRMAGGSPRGSRRRSGDADQVLAPPAQCLQFQNRGLDRARGG